MVDTEMQSAGSKGLPEIIRQISPDQTERNDTVSIVKQSQTSPTVTQTASALPESQAGKIENQTGQTENQAGETENDSATDDILAQLADLEAEVMDMLDDTNSFEPQIVAPVQSVPEIVIHQFLLLSLGGTCLRPLLTGLVHLRPRQALV